MVMNTKIEWADHTFNPWVGCQKVSPGCDHCYAESWAKRSGQAQWGPHAQRRRTSDANWRQPLKWNEQAAASQAAWEKFASDCRLSDEELHRNGFVRPCRPRVFCASLADVFDNSVPIEWREDLFRLIWRTPYLDWLLLTKRIGNAPAMLSIIPGWIPDNVWIGASIVNQEEADRDIPKLLAVPAAKRFLSMEPLLGPVNPRLLPADTCASNCCGMQYLDGLTGKSMCDLTEHPFDIGPRVDWVIVGGESGPGARPMHPDWVRSLRDQCKRAWVPFFFKQWGEWAPADVIVGGDLGGELERGTVEHLHAVGNPEGHFRRGDAYVRRVGKKRAGRLLDGRTWDEVPA